MTTNGMDSTAGNGRATTNQFLVPGYAGCPARHFRFAWGKFHGMKLSEAPGWYIHWILLQPNLDHRLREIIFETLQTSADRRYAVEQIVGTRVTKLLDEADARR